MKGKLVASIFAAVSLMSGAASAGSITCSGTVELISFHAPDRFMVRLSSMDMPVFFCTTNATWSISGAGGFTTSPETCRAFVAMFIAARESGRSFGGIWLDGDDAPASCNAWGSWKSANIRHFLY
jgi:hypothetical protein